MASILSLSAAIWWAVAIAGLLGSVVVALCFPRPRRPAREATERRPVSAIVPIKELDAGFEEAQCSLLEQAYGPLDIVIASAEEVSPALAAVRSVLARYPDVPSRIVRSTTERAASPKLSNLWAAICQAASDLIVTKDSNILLAPGDLECLVCGLEPGVGVVSAITIATEPKSLPAWVEAAVVNASHARFLMLARAIGFGFGCGKIMVFRRSDLERAGGLQRLAWALGEDAAMSDALADIGLRTVLSDRVTRQPLGRRSWREVWNRQLRWRLIWRTQAPAVFAIAPLGSALLAALAGTFAAPMFGYSPITAAVETLGLWFCAETVLCLTKSWPTSLWSPLGFVGREILDLAVWLKALTTSDVAWAGAVYHARVPILVTNNPPLATALSKDVAHDA
jgi:ceramide glucosyltransferase